MDPLRWNKRRLIWTQFDIDGLRLAALFAWLGHFDRKPNPTGATSRELITPSTYGEGPKTLIIDSNVGWPISGEGRGQVVGLAVDKTSCQERILFPHKK